MRELKAGHEALPDIGDIFEIAVATLLAGRDVELVTTRNERHTDAHLTAP